MASNTNYWNWILILLIVVVLMDVYFMLQGGGGVADLARKNRYDLMRDFVMMQPKETVLLDQQRADDDEPTRQHAVAGLNCDPWGGPPNDLAAEMVYWQDIPVDAKFVSPYKKKGDEPQYLTFEADEGGWNNIRMAMETAVALAHAMGRILVMPPEQGMYLLEKSGARQKRQKNRFTFTDFFHFDSVETEHAGVEIISFQEFLEREVMTGHVRDKATGQVTFPPDNRTDWNGIHRGEISELSMWMRSFGTNPIWFFDKCMAAFPLIDPPGGQTRLQGMLDTVLQTKWQKRHRKHVGNPVPVDGAPLDRLEDNLGHRQNLCIYNETYQNTKIFHLMGDNASGARLLVHFYAFLFFEDWRQDLWTKRFIRDHLRYVDEIQCAAARVVQAVRAKARENDPNNSAGIYDSFHIRRGDFQYKETRIDADQIYENIRDKVVPQSTIYIASDERDKSFFTIFRQHHHVYFLDDFLDVLGPDINTNFFGMLDQLIASRGRTFIGTYYSTFTGYINRVRGHHAQKDNQPGAHEQGTMNSWYYVPKQNINAVSEYRGISPPMWAREFPVGWRDLNHGIESLAEEDQ